MLYKVVEVGSIILQQGIQIPSFLGVLSHEVSKRYQNHASLFFCNAQFKKGKQTGKPFSLK